MKPEPIKINVDHSKILMKSGVRLGVTYTHRALDNYGHPEAVSRAEGLLKDTSDIYNIHIHGWGSQYPETSPGVWNWTNLDSRVAAVEKMGKTLVMTLCAAPDWMKGPYDPEEEKLYSDHGQRWWWFERAPLPEYFEEFANVAVEVARRYPQIRYF